MALRLLFRYQIRFLLKHPIAANPGQTVEGTLRMVGNTQQSYYITIKVQISGTDIKSESAVIDLKDPGMCVCQTQALG